MNENTLSRRDAFKLLAAASAAGAIFPRTAQAQTPPALTPVVGSSMLDPDFQNPVSPWGKLLSPPELATFAVLVDLILPADADSPAATEVGVPEFLNDWVSAPYPQNVEDRELLRGGVAWLNSHSYSKHGTGFVEIPVADQTAILDSICDPAKAAPELAYGARFFRKLRMLTLGGYYTHSKTWKSLGYIGNTPMAGAYPGVSDEIIKILGLESVI